MDLRYAVVEVRERNYEVMTADQVRQAGPHPVRNSKGELELVVLEAGPHAHQRHFHIDGRRTAYPTGEGVVETVSGMLTNQSITQLRFTYAGDPRFTVGDVIDIPEKSEEDDEDSEEPEDLSDRMFAKFERGYK